MIVSRLIEDLYINPENESGESLKTSEASGTYKMTFYHNDKLYSNTSGLKTLISVKFDLEKLLSKSKK
jgi:hypothetical protein